MATTAKITDKTLVEVFNTSTGSVSYKPEMSTISRKWERQNAVKKVELGELKNVVATIGGYTLFEEDILLIKDNTIREILGLNPITTYVKTLPELTQMLKAGTKAELVDFVENCTQDMLDAVVKTAIDTKLSDLNKVKVIEDYSGVKVVDHIKIDEATEATEQKPTGGAKRKPRQPKSE